jgi:hypothetical protein
MVTFKKFLSIVLSFESGCANDLLLCHRPENSEIVTGHKYSFLIKISQDGQGQKKVPSFGQKRLF